jgi:hypothetical protein
VQTGGIASLVGRTMEDVERDLILETLGHTLGNRTHAATILGISIRALRNKLRDYAAQGLAVTPPGMGQGAMGQGGTGQGGTGVGQAAGVLTAIPPAAAMGAGVLA